MLVSESTAPTEAAMNFDFLFEITTSRRMLVLLSFLLSCARRKSTAVAKIYVIDNIWLVWILESWFRVP